MYVIKLTYLKPLEQVNQALEDHRAHLVAHFASGHFLASGPQIPRVGGVILAKAGSKAEIDSIVLKDPFIQKGLVSYEITEFRPTMTCDVFEGLKA